MLPHCRNCPLAYKFFTRQKAVAANLALLHFAF